MLGKIAHFVATASALAALIVCVQLLETHLQGSSGSRWFDAACGAAEDGEASACQKVLASRFSYFPPRPPVAEDGTRPADRVPRVPSAFLGMVYYTSIAIWLLCVGAPSADRRYVHALPMLLVAAGFCFSLYYLYIMSSELNEWCPWCLVTHVLNIVIFICLAVMFPRRAAQAAEPRGYPSMRLVFASLLAVALGVYGQFYLLATKNWRKAAEIRAAESRRLEAELRRFADDTDKLVRNWELQEACQIPARDDETVRTNATAGQFTWDVVVFSDFECGACNATARRLEEKILPMFDGRLRIIYRHYPLHADCNASTKSTMHPHACAAAAMAEAARLLGGNEGFWSAHDYIYDRQLVLKVGRLTPENVAEDLGFDPSSFVEAMSSEDAARRVWEDVNAGASCHIRATPGIFVKGKLVNALSNKDLDFWDALATRFWREAREPRPASTRTLKREPDDAEEEATP